MSEILNGNYIAHVGVGHDDNPPGRGSGRYEYGTGDNPGQHEPWFQWSRKPTYIDKANGIREYKQMGYTDEEIATGLGLKLSEVKNYASYASKAERSYNMNLCRQIANTYMAEGKDPSPSQIAKDLTGQLGKKINESTVRSWLDETRVDRKQEMDNIVTALEKTVKKKKYVDVGKGTEACLNITKSQLQQALFIMQQNGYHVEKIKMEQLGTGHKTNLMVLTGPETTYSDLSKNRGKIQSVTDFKVSDDGKTLFGIEYPAALDSKRVAVRYAEEGGVDRDGVIEIRRGLDDLSLGNANYAQVRINVDNTHYIKGVAVYSDDLPKGVDVLFNANYSVGTPMLGEKNNTVFKPLKRDKLTGEIDKDNPFGAQIKPNDSTGDFDENGVELTAGGQYHYKDKDGNWKLSPINKVSEEGDWDKWSRTLPTQFLSKQAPALIEHQLNLAMAKKKAEFDEIKSLTNPAIKQELLLEFADSCDSDAVELRGHSLPGQRTQLLLPCPTLKEGEIYAPNYRNGERLALIRFPHSGQFEIPICTVNNNNKFGKDHIGKNALDAVGITHETAAQLAGADFDGDTAMCIPIDRGVSTLVKGGKPYDQISEAEKELRTFDPKAAYPYREGMKVMKDEQERGLEMGKVTNLIMDMTLQNAPIEELVPAVKHSMVVVDAYKHRLDFKQSEIDNHIASLNKKYRGSAKAGASTLITRATSPAYINERKDYYKIDPTTGEKIFSETGAMTTNRKGETKLKQQKVHKMELVSDAEELLSDMRHPKELTYAKFANDMKAMGNEARLEYLHTENGTYNKSAAKTYEKEVASLEAKLQNAYKNAPRERQAQVFANAIVYEKKKAYNFELEKDQLKKIKAQSLANARARFGAKKKDSLIEITPDEWKAIESGALRHSKVKEIINNSDKDKVRDYATPRTKKGVSKSVESLIKSYSKGDYTQAEIAEALGISVSTVNQVING